MQSFMPFSFRTGICTSSKDELYFTTSYAKITSLNIQVLKKRRNTVPYFYKMCKFKARPSCTSKIYYKYGLPLLIKARLKNMNGGIDMKAAEQHEILHTVHITTVEIQN